MNPQQSGVPAGSGHPDLLPDGSPVGWRVIDPDGNVVDSGPLMFAELVADTGEEGA